MNGPGGNGRALAGHKGPSGYLLGRMNLEAGTNPGPAVQSQAVTVTVNLKLNWATAGLPDGGPGACGAGRRFQRPTGGAKQAASLGYYSPRAFSSGPRRLRRTCISNLLR
jgi:hypothetical protein